MAKVLISLPDQLLADIDRAAAERGASRSRFIQDAARRELGAPSAIRIARALARGREALSGVGEFEAADLIHTTRTSRDAGDRRR